MKKLFVISLALGLLGAAYAQDCCGKAEAKADAKKQQCDSSAKKQGCGMTMSAEDQFLAEAKKMEAQAAPIASAKEECCKSTAEKPMAKGDPGCCNAKGEPAKFKVYVAGAGYKYFGCEESAAKGRKELLARNAKVGPVQKVQSKTVIH